MNFLLKNLIVYSLILFCFQGVLVAQENTVTQPVWWFGVAGAANMNFYRGTTQMLNFELTTPTAFHKGFGAGLYLAPLVEYRPSPIWGGMLQVGYDDRRGAFDDVPCPCGEIASLSSTVSYISLEPSLRIAPFSNGFHIYAGPRIGFNWSPSPGDEKEFLYEQRGHATTRSQFNQMRSTVYSGQVGIGYDFALSSPNDVHKVDVSPFVALQFLGGPRSGQSWAITTLRLGAAIKFGTGTVIPAEKGKGTGTGTSMVTEYEVEFSVRAPKAVPVKRNVRETFPLRNYVFFDDGSTEIPNRYVSLTKSQASDFKEEQLQEVQPKSTTGRSLRQMTVYYNILNIIGDRMKRNPGTAITLTGASEKGPDHGKQRAETIKQYLVEVFGIEGSRIKTVGRDKPLIPSELPGGTKELEVLRAGDNRVDIESNSAEMMIQVGGTSYSMLKPVQILAVVEDPLDSHILFNAVGAKESFSSWSLEIIDDQGKIQHYGPFTGEQANVSGNVILGSRSKGEYKIVMIGNTKNGKTVRKESSVSLVRRDTPEKDAVRFSILFDFDKSKSIASYEKFLVDIVTPLIPKNGIVVIHGYTDDIGEEEYNDNLSRKRVEDARSILEQAISKKGTQGVTFETFGFGEDLHYAPFENTTPEGRFYNRTVIIDIVPD